MPAEHCPECGAARTADGCACSPDAHPDLTETAVLPHIEGPPLVRPYVPAPVQYDEPPYEPAYAPTHAQDAFSTTLMPPVPPQPQAGGPIPEPPQVQRHTHRQAAPGRRRAVVLAAGAGIAALGVGIAFALTPPSDSSVKDRALPPAAGTLQADTSTLPTPTASTSASASASPSRSRTAGKTPTSQAPTTELSPSAAPSTATTSAKPSTSAPSTSASASAAPRTLKYKDKGADVLAMQEKLAEVLCWMYVPTSGTFDRRTEDAVSYFQSIQGVQGDPDGVYGPSTRAALEGRTGC
ncbi:hypothetical protein GCM10010193_65390 [Kitasatospora atroaurantiaca]|uniref:Putative peptidoglycan binding protein n=1 Tax=Kitasatospora atroaurantiaca TaxID=285545 RepID=A0A561EMJ4_9ACTN|nr:peptidoglycan-binding domain-containing protein [Kitasatospora atroaurantiaca]TWE16834.1 putative peptidoglycan binding protein [Kitasatospora atroaurantiaca]